MPGRRIALVLVLVIAALALAGCGGGDDEASVTTETETTTETTTPSGTTLQASVGPGFEISLTQDGQDVATLAAGEYTIEVDDQSDIHNFHLTGPGGVDEDSGVSETGTSTWTVTFEAGSYHFQCDPHASQMNGDFEVTG